MQKQHKTKEICAVQVRLLTSDDVRKRSVVNVTNTILHRRVGALQNSLNDTRMGSGDATTPCGQCGEVAEKCPGHSGRIELSQPVINAELLPIAHKVLTSICVACSACLITPNHPQYKKITKLSPDDRLKAIYHSALRVRRCGMMEITKYVEQYNHEPDFTNMSCEELYDLGYCGSAQPLYFERTNQKLLVRPVYELPGLPSHPNELPRFTAHDQFDMIADASPKTSVFLGFGTEKTPTLDGLVWSLLHVPENLTRPAIRGRSDDDLTIRLREILRVNNPSSNLSLLKESARVLYNNLAMFIIPGDDKVISNGSVFFDETDIGLPDVPGDTSTISNNRVARKRRRVQSSRHLQLRLEVIPQYLDDYFGLVRQCTGYQNTKLVSKLDRDFGRELACVRDRYKNNNGRHGRMRSSGMGKRGDQTGRAVITCNTQQDINEITIPRAMAMKLSYKEPVTIYNMKKMLILVDNGPMVYPGATQIDRDGRSYSLRYIFNPQIKVGDIIHRHILDGDIMGLNRQPSLHRWSLLAYRIRVCMDMTIKLHLSATVSHGADFDGDEMNLIGYISYMAKAEACALMGIENNMVKGGQLIVCFVQHAIIGAYKLSMAKQISRKHLQQLATVGEYAPLRDRLASLSLLENVSGIDFIRAVFDMHQDHHIPTPVTKKQLNYYGFLMWHRRGGYATMKSMSAIIRMFEYYLSIETCSISFHDCMIPLPSNTIDEIQLGIDFVDNDKIPTTNTEIVVCKILDEVRLRGGIKAMEIADNLVGKNNNLHDLVKAGAKGNPANFIQNSVCVGQQYTGRCKRPPELVHAVTISEKRGFVRSSFCDGLNSTEFAHHMGSSREGLIGTSVKTAETGYIGRKIGKALEDLTAFFDGSVRDASGNVFDNMYGGDGFDSNGLVSVDPILVTLPLATLHAQFAQENTPVDEIELLVTIRERVLPMCVHTLHYGEIYTTSPIDVQSLLLYATDSGIDNTINQPPHMSRVQISQVVNSALLNYSRTLPILLYTYLLFELRSFQCIKYIGYSATNIIKFVKHIMNSLERAQVHNGAPVGHHGGDSTSEPIMQMQLNTFHDAGSALASGVPRCKQLINCSETSTPSMTIVFKNNNITPTDIVGLYLTDCIKYWSVMDHTSPHKIHVDSCRNLFMPNTTATPKFTIILTLHDNLSTDAIEICASLASNTLPPSAHLNQLPQLLRFNLGTDGDCAWFGIDVYDNFDLLQATLTSLPPHQTNQTEFLAMSIYERFMFSLRKYNISGVADITSYEHMSNTDARRKRWCIQDGNLQLLPKNIIITRGDNTRDILARDDVDISMSHTNDIHVIYKYFGIDAVRNAINYELNSTLITNTKSVSRRHIDLISTAICFTGRPCGFSFSGFLAANTSPLKLASFERVVESFVRLAKHAHIDNLQGVSESCLFGVRIKHGSGLRSLELKIQDTAKPLDAITVSHAQHTSQSLNMYGDIMTKGIPMDILSSPGTIHELHSQSSMPSYSIAGQSNYLARRRRQRDMSLSTNVPISKTTNKQQRTPARKKTKTIPVSKQTTSRRKPKLPNIIRTLRIPTATTTNTMTTTTIATKLPLGIYSNCQLSTIASRICTQQTPTAPKFPVLHRSDRFPTGFSTTIKPHKQNKPRTTRKKIATNKHLRVVDGVTIASRRGGPVILDALPQPTEMRNALM